MLLLLTLNNQPTLIPLTPSYNFSCSFLQQNFSKRVVSLLNASHFLNPKGHLLVLILFDFSAASETTDHSPLLHLAPRTPCSWFSSHLTCCFFLLPGILTLEGPRAQYLARFSSTAQLYQSALTNAYQHTKHFHGFKYCLYANYSPSYLPFQTFLPIPDM